MEKQIRATFQEIKQDQRIPEIIIEKAAIALEQVKSEQAKQNNTTNQEQQV